jgi:P27 family predicted phage terminase small subunit
MARRNAPNAVLKKRGSKHFREDEPEQAQGEVIPTRALGVEAQKAFARLCKELDEIGVLSPTYAEIITIAADAIGDIEIASADLMERGQISITERGEIKNPSWTIKTSAQTTAHKYLCSLGLSPTTIAKLAGGKKEEVNEFDED